MDAEKKLRKFFYLLLTGVFLLFTFWFYWSQSIRKDISLCRSMISKHCQGNITLIHKLLVLAEDHRSELHYGLDFIGIVRAFKTNLFNKKRQGASTIEQQLVRVITSRREMTRKRKLREQFLAVIISYIFSKDEIYIAYINLGYYGESFERNKQLKVATYECCYTLIAYLKYPKPSRPTIKHTHKISRRVNHIKNLESGSHQLIWRVD